jgi:DNA-directed RNA polymerase subunit beta'
VPTQDIVLGLYYMTRERPEAADAGKKFSNPEEVRIAYDHGAIGLHTPVSVRMDGKLVDTTVGRVLLYEIVPREIPFTDVNKVMKKKELGNLVDLSYRLSGNKATVIFADKLKDLGFEYATKAGISIAIRDMVITSKKPKLLEQAARPCARSRISTTRADHRRRAVQQGRRHLGGGDRPHADEMLRELATDTVEGEGGKRYTVSSFNPIS